MQSRISSPSPAGTACPWRRGAMLLALALGLGGCGGGDGAGGGSAPPDAGTPPPAGTVQWDGGKWDEGNWS